MDVPEIRSGAGGVREPRFDFDVVFGEDYLYFYDEFLTPERSDEEAELIARLLELEPGMEILDLACGHGRIANRLAARGARVTGLDANGAFLEQARADAAERGVEVDYVEGDMRSLPWSERFDCVVNWFTAFGYFDDENNRRVLARVCRALKPGGRLLLEVQNRDRVLRTFREEHVGERGDDFMIDYHEYDVASGQMRTERVVIRAGVVRRGHFFVRMFTFTELRDWLLHAGFTAVDGFGSDGELFTLESRRMLVRAGR